MVAHHGVVIVGVVLQQYSGNTNAANHETAPAASQSREETSTSTYKQENYGYVTDGPQY